MSVTLTTAEVESLRMSLQGRFGEAATVLADGHQGTLVDLRRLLAGIESAVVLCGHAAGDEMGNGGTPEVETVSEAIRLGIGGKRAEWARFVSRLSAEDAAQVRNALSGYGPVVSAAAVTLAART